MATDRSVARVTVRQEGKWEHARENRAKRRTSSTTSSTARSNPSSTDRGISSGRGGSAREDRARQDRAREDDPWHRVEVLEAELERKERGLQDVIDRYERILAEKERQLTAENRTTSSTGRQPSVLSTILGYVTDR